MGRAKGRARPLYALYFRSAGSHIASQGLKGAGSPQEPPSPKTAAYQRPGHRQMGFLHRQTSGTALQPSADRPTPPARHLACTQRAHALRLAQSSCWPARERVHPGVTTALSLTLVAASLVGWQGPPRGMRVSMPGCH